LFIRAHKPDTALGCVANAIELERRAGRVRRCRLVLCPAAGSYVGAQEMEVFGVPPRRTSAAAHLYMSALLVEVGRCVVLSCPSLALTPLLPQVS
jgi:hypothetical protein